MIGNVECRNEVGNTVIDAMLFNKVRETLASEDQ